MNDSAQRESSLRVADFQRREWTVQRYAWLVMWAILGAGIAGLFGRGPLARARIETSGWRVEYERFARNNTQTSLAITLPTAQSGDTATLWVDRVYAEAMDIRRVTPEPLTVSVRPDRLVYRFLTGGAGSVRLVFDLEPQEIGRMNGLLGSSGSGTVTFSQLIYP
jgi:hypothetical protein